MTSISSARPDMWVEKPVGDQRPPSGYQKPPPLELAGRGGEGDDYAWLDRAVERGYISADKVDDLAQSFGWAPRLVGRTVAPGTDLSAVSGDLVANSRPTWQDPSSQRLVGGWQDSTGAEGHHWATPADSRAASHNMYDLYAYREADGSYTARLTTNAEFRFVGEGPGGGAWTEEQKLVYIHNYERSVESVFDGQILGTAPDGNFIRLDVDIKSSIKDIPERQTGWQPRPQRTFSDEPQRRPHLVDGTWTINVSGDLDRANVRYDNSTVSLGHHSNLPVRLIGADTDRPVYNVSAHEFGHMIGLPDEYFEEGRPVSPFVDDRFSIMNFGGEVRPRHLNRIYEEAYRAIDTGRILSQTIKD